MSELLQPLSPPVHRPAPGSGPVAPVASQPPPGASGNTPAPARAPLPADYGGNASGRAPRVFRFPPDTPEGKSERRHAEAERKKAARAVAKTLEQPPPLPSRDAPGGAPAPVVGGASSPARVPVAFGGAEGSAGAEPAPLPWHPDILGDLVNELLQAAEQGRVAAFVAKCEKAGLLPKLVREIEADAHFPKMAKVLLARSLPRLAAKWLNKAGISAEYQDELSCVTALLLIVQHDRKLGKKLDELIRAAKDRQGNEGQGNVVKMPKAAAAP